MDRGRRASAAPAVGAFFLCLCCLCLWGSVAAATLRCGTQVIRVGDSVTRVREQCGEPSSIESETRAFPNGGRLDDRCFFGTVTVQMWHYDRRSGGLPTTLFVVDGKVERIQLETGGYRAGWTSSCR